MHAGDREPHEGRGERGRGDARRNRAVKAEADTERDEGKADRDNNRYSDESRVVTQQCLGLHCRHSRVMHEADRGAHQDAADGQPLKAWVGALADDVQCHAAREDARDHRQHGSDRGVGHAAGQGEGEHADEVHAPNAATHGQRPGARPGPAGAARVRGDDASGNRQSDKRGERRDNNRQRDEADVVGTGMRRRRINLVVNREEAPIEIKHARPALSNQPQCSQLFVNTC